MSKSTSTASIITNYGVSNVGIKHACEMIYEKKKCNNIMENKHPITEWYRW